MSILLFLTLLTLWILLTFPLACVMGRVLKKSGDSCMRANNYNQKI